MGFLSSFLVRRTYKAIERRRSIFGLEPPAHIPEMLGQESSWYFKSTLSVVGYLLFLSPKAILTLAWLHITDRDTPRKRKRIQHLAEVLRPVLSKNARVVDGYFERRLYSRDLARVPRILEKSLHRTTPLLVVQPRTEDDIRAVLRVSSDFRIPVYPRGVASSAFGGAVPTMNGIVLDLSPMMDILEIDVEQRKVRVQPGVRWSDLADRLKPYGLCPVATPTSLFSTIAGWVATGGLGIGGFGYGHVIRSVLGAKIALPNGTLLELGVEDRRLRSFIGTEGQFGIFTELTLQVRESARHSRSFLYYFDGLERAFVFIQKLVDRAHRPSHVAFYDRVRLQEENLLFCEKTGSKEPIVKEREAVLLHFDNLEEQGRFQADTGLTNDIPSDPVAASMFWSDRFFPLKAQRIGPSMLASEVVLPLESVPIFIRRSKKYAGRFGTPLAFEVFVARTTDRRNCVVIASFLCDASRPDYFLRLAFVQLLTNLGVRIGGRPYGFGIWNSPFLGRLFPKEERSEMLRYKKECDPHCLLNPQKFFSLRSRMRNLLGLLFIPRIYRLVLGVAAFCSPVIGPIARGMSGETGNGWQVPSIDEQEGAYLIRETEARCTSCGGCISVCPAFLVTKEELVTGRAKLRVAKVLATGGKITAAEALSTFQCLHCGLCEEVCQTRLPLLACYDVLEEMCTRRYGRPDRLISDFLEQVDRAPKIVLGAYGLARPAWSPSESFTFDQLDYTEVAG